MGGMRRPPARGIAAVHRCTSVDRKCKEKTLTELYPSFFRETRVFTIRRELSHYYNRSHGLETARPNGD